MTTGFIEILQLRGSGGNRSAKLINHPTHTRGVHPAIALGRHLAEVNLCRLQAYAEFEIGLLVAVFPE
jgi:hypothetical protein